MCLFHCLHYFCLQHFHISFTLWNMCLRVEHLVPDTLKWVKSAVLQFFLFFSTLNYLKMKRIWTSRFSSYMTPKEGGKATIYQFQNCFTCILKQLNKNNTRTYTHQATWVYAESVLSWLFWARLISYCLQSSPKDNQIFFWSIETLKYHNNVWGFWITLNNQVFWIIFVKMFRCLWITYKSE